MKLTVVIHGASSFLGKNFIQSLNPKEFNIIVFSRINQNVDFLSEEIIVYNYSDLDELLDENLNIEVNSFFYEFSWHGVFNDKRNDQEQLTINIPLMINSVKLAKKIKSKHWIGIGSQAEYGLLNFKITESNKCNPTTLYGKSKLFCSQITQELCMLYGIGFTWLRLFSLYGPNDSHDWFVYYLVRRLLNDEEINMTAGEQKWDYLYIDDAVDVLRIILDKNKSLGITNYASGKNIKLKDFVLLAKKIAGSKSIINFGKIPYRKDQVMNMEVDVSKICNLLGWQTKFSYADGLEKLIKEYKNEKIGK